MQLIKHASTSKDIMPLISALPYSVILDENEEMTEESVYDPISQQTVYQAGRDYSTSRSDDSAGGFFSTKSDTKKDD